MRKMGQRKKVGLGMWMEKLEKNSFAQGSAASQPAAEWTQQLSHYLPPTL